MRTTKLVKGKWPGVLLELGVKKEFLDGYHGPCPFCGGEDRFRFDNWEGNGTYYCNQCGSGDGWKFAQLYFGLPFKTLADRIDKFINNIKVTKLKTNKDPEKIRARLKEIQADLVPWELVEPVELYLHKRGLFHANGKPPATIKAHHALEYFDKGKLVGEFPAMVAYIINSAGAPVSMHITYLDSEGNQLKMFQSRKVLPYLIDKPMVPHIKLYPYADLMGVAEGVETAIAATNRFGVNTVSCLNAVNMEKYEPPQVCKELVIFGDNDYSFTGQKAAYLLANKLEVLSARELKVTVEIPTEAGTDWADV